MSGALKKGEHHRAFRFTGLCLVILPLGVHPAGIQHDDHIRYVGAGRPGGDEVATRREKTPGIGGLQTLQRIQTAGRSTGNRLWVHQGAGRSGWPIRAIRAGGQQDKRVMLSHPRGGRERQALATPAPAGAGGQSDGGFAAP